MENCICIETPSAALNQLLLSNNYSLVKVVGRLDWIYLHQVFLDEWLDKLV